MSTRKAFPAGSGTHWLPRSLATQLYAALLLLFLAATASVGFTLYELDLRKHDYVILNLTGQLRAISQNLVQQSLRYQHAPANDGAAYLQDIARQAALFERIVSSLRNRLLEPELTGRSDPLVCSWDSQSIGQLELTATTWGVFRNRMEKAVPQGAVAVSRYIVDNENGLTIVAANLSGAFQRMMEGKMALIVTINKVALAATAGLVVVLLLLLHLTFLRPLRHTLQGIERVSRGSFDHRLAVSGGEEINRVATAFNRLASRIESLFRLTRRIDEADDLGQTLNFVFEEFRALLPLDWIGMLSPDSTENRFVLERRFGGAVELLQEGDRFAAEGSLLARALVDKRPLQIDDLAQLVAEHPDKPFARCLHEAGFRSALFFPLGGEGEWAALLAFASTEPAAYGHEHLELLENIAAQVSHGFEKTVVTENLVVSAITGLAKLAESRDSETGDHLLRMARYSAILAEELGRVGPHAGCISSDMVRDILHFAPMHDIGKVGIADRILLKSGRLDEAERVEMERHPVIGGEVLRRCEAQMNAVGHSVFRTGIEIAECHHERFDGGGYPRGLEGQAIPLSARIVTVADVFDALTSRRPYKGAWPIERALDFMHEQAGGHFDPEVVAAMGRALPRIMEVYAQHRHI